MMPLAVAIGAGASVLIAWWFAQLGSRWLDLAERRFTLAALPEAPMAPMAPHEKMPTDLWLRSLEESEEWAQVQMRDAMAEAYATLGDWNAVREAFQMPASGGTL